MPGNSRQLDELGKGVAALDQVGVEGGSYGGRLAGSLDGFGLFLAPDFLPQALGRQGKPARDGGDGDDGCEDGDGRQGQEQRTDLGVLRTGDGQGSVGRAGIDAQAAGQSR